MLAAFLAFGLLAALAQDAPAADPPLALPEPPPALRLEIDAQRLAALRQYRDRRLVLRPETEHHGSTAHVVGMGGGGPWGRGWGGWYHEAVMVDPITTTRTWGVYKGPQRLSVPDFLAVTGEQQRKAELDQRIERARTASRGWFTLAGIGGAGILTGLVGMGMADTREEWASMNLVTLGGSALLVTGLIGGSFPSGKRHALLRYPSASLGAEESQSFADRYNERLREELGLTPQEVWSIEAREPR